MRLRAILLRLLLCLALVANGTSAVYASARMAFDGGMSTTAIGREAEPPCHDMAAMQDGVMVADTGTHAPPAGSHDDCCPPGACLCSCVSHAPSILTVHAVALTTGPAASPVSALLSSHASPALLHLIRPPIG